MRVSSRHLFLTIGDWLIIVLVGLHVSAVLFYALVKKDNLVRPMITASAARMRSTTVAL